MKTIKMNPTDRFVQNIISAAQEFNDAMYDKDLREIEMFEQLLESETKLARESFEKAKKEYEEVFKNFLIKHVTGDDFEDFHKRAWEGAVENLYPEVAISLIDELEVYGNIVTEHYWWIQEGRYLDENGELLSEYR
jgi:hypothetical protein